MKRIRAVIVGAGAISENHLKAMQDSSRTELLAVADLEQQRLEQCAAAYSIRTYHDYKAMILQERPDVVVITLPHFLHKEAVIWCAEQDCHVLVEKPMAMNVQECREMNEAAARNGIILAVGHMQHYFPALIRAREILRSGRLGKLIMMDDRRWCNYFHPGRPAWFLERAKSGGGIVVNLGSHSIDKLQWLTDSRVTSVKASLTAYGERGDVEGSASLFLETTEGVTATVSLCGYRQSIVNETELLLTGGQLKLQGSNKLWLYDGQSDGYEAIDTDDLPEAFAAQWDDMLNAVQFGGELGISGEYGQSVASVVEAIYRSHSSGREQIVII
ncbi:Gfo/Idh/MocA family oxidoreductase [Paenibacillus sp. J5C_2022]|uniref:Gfo/Idh/MocA family protein n=1 Tax=Paenibacillus sp. J5C2022 TaxID=2977129 RepID=UPI0021D14217|nr:Gfo/Idh/MocA family oxidoreductase [Paenibacillus sp. J5C2022]MCU6707430.1 Gfo/Idh/MocA family oxidoreductase [Paenibacillus sp. J5C2022]